MTTELREKKPVKEQSGSGSDDAAVRLQTDGPLARVTIDNPSQRNAMTVSMWESLSELLDRIAADSDIRALVVTGAGDRAFCAGASIDDLTVAMDDPAEMRRQNALIRDVQMKLQRLPRPTLAVVRGACYGGGCGLALACDIRLAETSATFAITPAKLGILYSLPDTKRLINAVGAANARDMLLTGLPVTAARAQQIGLIQHLADTPLLQQKEQELVESLVNNSQYSLRWSKATVEFLAGVECATGEDGKAAENALLQAFDEAFDGRDFREGSSAFRERRKPFFRWPEDGED
ncbi:putative enoyl-CoA hydratase [Microbulbifer aggregans]|uniref:Putative enoyl-CoA hydratase n=1 Tax=Microbulbifer aggregans TaxID=1769779 RepID=A0A1C9WAX9_9GAMM|nr:enoyl-CoA hydratase-related protein [Microbulbifer aggregans]AOS98315.1 putative enoyl-CoA hydratase [Microbulbifer aggregans]